MIYDLAKRPEVYLLENHLLCLNKALLFANKKSSSPRAESRLGRLCRNADAGRTATELVIKVSFTKIHWIASHWAYCERMHHEATLHKSPEDEHFLELGILTVS